MKDSGHLKEIQFSFSLSEKMEGLNLVQFADTTLHKPGVWGPLRAPEAVALLAVKYALSHFSWHFFFKQFNLHL